MNPKELAPCLTGLAVANPAHAQEWHSGLALSRQTLTPRAQPQLATWAGLSRRSWRFPCMSLFNAAAIVLLVYAPVGALLSIVAEAEDSAPGGFNNPLRTNVAEGPCTSTYATGQHRR